MVSYNVKVYIPTIIFDSISRHLDCFQLDTVVLTPNNSKSRVFLHSFSTLEFSNFEDDKFLSNTSLTLRGIEEATVVEPKQLIDFTCHRKNRKSPFYQRNVPIFPMSHPV
uniref:Uncharacterized protein n=1 Tax=Cacopsylla melanoneura TaxID=428564 RepID=A0A8D9B0H0_9HEMI